MYRDDDSEEPKRPVVFQAEEADKLHSFRGWFIDDETQIVGFADDFDLIDQEEHKSELRGGSDAEEAV